MATNNTYIKRKSPLGVVKFAHIDRPSDKFGGDPKYSLDLILDPNEEDTKALTADLTRLAEDAKARFLAEEKNPAKKKAIEKFDLHVPIVPDIDKEGTDTGMVVLRSSQKATITRKSGETINKIIAAFDAKNKPLNDKRIGRGSKLKAAVTVVPFCMAATKRVGVTLWLEAVQVTEFRGYTGGTDAGSFGFEETDGYAETTPEPEDVPVGTGVEKSGDGSDF